MNEFKQEVRYGRQDPPAAGHARADTYTDADPVPRVRTQDVVGLYQRS